MEVEKPFKLMYHHKANRVIVFTSMSVQAILEAIGFKPDTIFGYKVLVVKSYSSRPES